MAQYIDFNYVKEHANVEAILTHYQLETTGSGAERRCRCPFHDDLHPSFSINVEDGKFNCHAASCGEKGNILDFVAAMEETDDLREASAIIGDICGIDLASPRSNKQTKRASSAKRTKRALNGKGKTRKAAGDDTDAKKAANETASNESESEGAAKPNSPLTFQLNLDGDHEYGKSRNLSAADIGRFEMGYCARGTMQGRWCIPYHNVQGDVIGYIGRYAADPVPESEAKYKLPKGFNKSSELFNLHRVAGHAKHVTIVEGVFDAIRLHGLAMPVVALVGTSISEAQIELLINSGFRSVTVILDNDAPDPKTRQKIIDAEKDIVHRFSRRLLVRSVELPEGTDPATAPEAFLRGRVPVFQS